MTTNNPVVLLFILTFCAFIGLLTEKSRYLSNFSSVFITMFLSACLSNAGVIPHTSPFYDMVWQYFVPLSIPFILMRAHLKTIVSESGLTLIAFIIGATGTVLGSVLAFLLVTLGDETWKIVSMFCATYIGGSINYVAVSKTLSLQDHNLFMAGNAADNVVMALYFATLSFISSSPLCKRIFKQIDAQPAPSVVLELGTIDVKSLILTLTISTGIYVLASLISETLNIQGIDILLITLFSLLVVNLCPKLVKKIVPCEVIGFTFLYIFFAVIGASADIALAVTMAPKIILIAFIIVAFHLGWLALWGKRLNLGLNEMIIASNANIGGPATAAAMASARQWPHLVVPGILCGTLGYAVSTFIGTSLGYILGR